MTQLQYPDLEASSRSGSYHCRAFFSQRRPGAVGAFEYVLEQGGETLWRRIAAGEHEEPPLDLFVDDTGYVVAMLHLFTYALKPLILALDGNTVAILDLASLLFDLGIDEQHLYSCNAGLLWRGSFTYHLLTDKGERFLFLVTTTGLEVGVNLSSGKFLDDLSEFAEGLDARRRQDTVRILRREASRLQLPAAPQRAGRNELGVALATAGLLKIQEATPALRVFEEHGTLADELGSRQFGPFNLKRLRLRQDAQLALRRLGHQPALLPAYELTYQQSNQVVELPACTSRLEGVDRLEPGISLLEVVQLLGAPDFAHSKFSEQLGRALSYWEYDLWDEEFYTLRVELNREEEAVAGLSIFRPPHWLEPDVRDQRIL